MKRQIIFVAILLIIIGGSSSLFADGKFYWPEEIPPDIPFQRALLMYDDNRETLILQSKYQLPHIYPDVSFGWVVPVPTVPDIASMEARYADFLFSRLRGVSRPSYFAVSSIVLFLSLLLCVSGVIVWILCVFAQFLPFLYRLKRNSKKLMRYGIYAILIGIFPVVITPKFAGNIEQSVEVLKAEKVGIYDVRVVKSEEATSLIAWLKENGFHFDDSDTQVFEDYIRKKWCFVTAKVQPGETHEAKEAVFNGLVAPLILRFKTNVPVYPLALTSLVGHDTKVLIYVLSQNKVGCDERMELYYADEANLFDIEEIELLQNASEPKNFFLETNFALPYLTTFEETMTSAEMKEDLAFGFTNDNQPFRKYEIRW